MTENEATANAQQLRELDAIHKASEQLHRLRDPEVLARDVITFLKDVVHHDFAAVYRIEGDRLKPFAVSDRGLGEPVLEADKAYLESLDLRVGENVTGWVAKHGESVLLDDVSVDPRYLDSRSHIQSELCVPMRSGDRIVGVVNLESTRPNAYAESDQRVLETVANQVAIAIENGQLLARAQEMQRLRTLADLTGGIAHDLGNLLVAASLHCDVARVQASQDTGRQVQLVAVNNILKKSIALTRSLLQIGLPVNTERGEVDLNRHLRESLPLLEAVCGNNMPLTLHTCTEPALIKASSGEIDQVMINLAVNAREAARGSGGLNIRTRYKGTGASASVSLDVEDDGCGMDATTLAAATAPNFTTRAEGSGLGLATVARLIDELNGELQIDSKPGRGTRVRITLPLCLHVDQPATAAS